MTVGVCQRTAVGEYRGPGSPLVGIDARVVIIIEGAVQMLPAAHVVVDLDTALRIVKVRVWLIRRTCFVDRRVRLRLVILMEELNDLPRWAGCDWAGWNLVIHEDAVGGR